MFDSAQRIDTGKSPAWVRLFSGAALTAMGVVIAHWVGYLVQYRDHTARSEALTGHRHLDLFGPTVVAIGIAAALLIAIVGARCVPAAQDPRASWVSLAGWQVAVFAALETVERLGSLSDLNYEPGVAFGLMLQIPVAWVLVSGIRLGASVIERVSLVPGAAASKFVASLSTAVVAEPQLILLPALRSPVSGRGPPLRLD